MPTVVTTVTARAQSADTLTDADYRDIYQEVRHYDAQTGEYAVSLRSFVTLVSSAMPDQSCLSIGYWSKYHNDAIPLTRRARTELRAVVGLPVLPPTVAEACATADPDATVHQVGAEAATRIVMVGRDVAEPITLHLNGHVDILPNEHPERSAAESKDAQQSDVTAVTRPSRPRTPSKAIRISPTAFARLQAHRQALNMTWDEFLTALLGEEEEQ